MARTTHTAPRAGGIGPAAAIAALLAVLAALLSPSTHGSTRSGVPDTAVVASGALLAGSGPYADDGRFATDSAAVRSHRDAPGERPSPPAPATLAPYCTAVSPPQAASSPLSVLRPPVAAQPADCHQMRAPPPPTGT